jgi:hypothetical protein
MISKPLLLFSDRGFVCVGNMSHHMSKQGFFSVLPLKKP